MKKKILALLVICTSFPSFAMDAPGKIFPQFAALPAELKTLIITTGVLQAKTYLEAIDAIKDQSLVNKTFRQIIKDNAAQFIEYLSHRYHFSAYLIAFKLGGLSEQWFGKKGLVKEGQVFNQTLLKELKREWEKSGQDLIRNAGQNNKKRVIRLLENGADPNFQDKNGVPALMRASFYNHKDVVGLLLKNGADPNIKDNKMGYTALFQASVSGQKEVVELLLENEADPNIQSKVGFTALMGASANNRKEVIELLLKNGANPNIQDKDGYTALIQASAVLGDKEVIELLLEHGADPNIKDKKEKTALDFAKEKGHTEIVKMLEEAIAKQQ